PVFVLPTVIAVRPPPIPVTSSRAPELRMNRPVLLFPSIVRIGVWSDEVLPAGAVTIDVTALNVFPELAITNEVAAVIVLLPLRFSVPCPVPPPPEFPTITVATFALKLDAPNTSSVPLDAVPPDDPMESVWPARPVPTERLLPASPITLPPAVLLPIKRLAGAPRATLLH